MAIKDIKGQIIDLIEEWAAKTKGAIRTELSWTDSLKNNVDIETGKDSIKLVMPKYGIFVDAGRKPGKQPPLNVIYEWVKKKGIPREAAFPIARKIGKEGLPAHPFIHIFEDGLDDLTDGIADIIGDAVMDEFPDKF